MPLKDRKMFNLGDYYKIILTVKITKLLTLIQANNGIGIYKYYKYNQREF